MSADIFIQWKGTNACFDFHCYSCNTFGHFDGDFCYLIKCPNCGQVYQLPSIIALKELNKPSKYHNEKIAVDCEQNLKECGWDEALPEGLCTYSDES